MPPELIVAPELQQRSWSAMTWPATVALVAGVLVLRIAYLVLMCGYELLGDEALYWECARRPALCYYEKGPGLPALIYVSMTLLGTHEWTIRLPVALCHALAALALARITIDASKGDTRCGFVAAALFMLMPAYQANAQISTPDGPLIAFWVLSCWAALRLTQKLERGEDRLEDWLLLALTIGVGTLCKQSMLLLLPGLATYLFLRRKSLSGRWATTLLRSVVATAGIVVVLSPMLVWNAQHGWPTLRHTLEHTTTLDTSAALATKPSRGLLWEGPFVLLAAQLGAFGPPAVILMILAARWSRRMQSPSSAATAFPEAGDGGRAARRLMYCLALPALAVYLCVSLVHAAQPNWPMHVFATLLVPAAQLAVIEIPRHRELLRQWIADPRRPRPKAGILRRRPETPFQVAWDWTLIYGVVGQLLIFFTPNLIPAQVRDGFTSRFRGHRERAARVEQLRQELSAAEGRPPLLITAHYMTAGLLAYYLPDRPTVFCAAHTMGGRHSSYDFWPDTDLNEPQLLGQPAILLGRRPDQWLAALCFATVEARDAEIGAKAARGFCGVR